MNRPSSLASRLLPSLLALSAAACAVESDKGVEDEVPEDGKADSFRAPTEHGTIGFDAASRAELSADERFHAWEFQLAGRADISLTVSADDRALDTVAYLYRRSDEDESWGPYVTRNDDAHDGTRSSQIADVYYEGMYRIIVKGYQDEDTGPFSLLLTCEGECDAATPPTELPGETGFGEGCGEEVDLAFRGNVVDEGATRVTFSGRDPFASISGDLRVALEFYAEAYASDLEALQVDELSVYTTRMQAGTIIAVDLGDYEHTITYAFTDAHGLAFSYRHTSPTYNFYCADEGAPLEEEPSTECGDMLIDNSPRDRGFDTHLTYRVGDDRDAMEPRLRAAAEAYLDLLEGDEATEDLYIEGEFWDNGAELVVSGEIGEASYLIVIDDANYGYVVTESHEGADAQLLCSNFDY